MQQSINKIKGKISNFLKEWFKYNDTNREYASLLQIQTHTRGSINETVDPCPSVLFWAQIKPP